MKRQQRKRRAGYVLIMTLAVISIAVILLTGFARHSLLLAIESSQAQDDLQRRWGIVACRRALLERAEVILARQAVTADGNESLRPHPAQVAAMVRLGEVQFLLILADEDAKVNLNAAYQHSRGSPMVRKLIGELSPPILPLQLRPHRNQTRQTAPAFTSWGQVFSLTTPSTEVSTPRGLVQSTQQLTCWGSGRLNVCRASDDALRAVCRLVGIGQCADKLMELRRQPRKRTLSGLLRAAGVPIQQLGVARLLLSDTSQTYSMWLEATSDHRQSHALFVDSSRRGAPHTAFVW